MPCFFQNIMNVFYFKFNFLTLKVPYQILKDSVKGRAMGEHFAETAKCLCTFLRSVLALLNVRAAMLRCSRVLMPWGDVRCLAGLRGSSWGRRDGTGRWEDGAAEVTQQAQSPATIRPGHSLISDSVAQAEARGAI